jgi:signal transduction histidine kinase
MTNVTLSLLAALFVVMAAAQAEGLTRSWWWSWLQPIGWVVPFAFVAAATMLVFTRMRLSCASAAAVGLGATATALSTAISAPALVRSLGLSLGSWTVPALMLLVLSLTSTPGFDRSRRALALLLFTIGMTGALRAAMYEPFTDPSCTRFCAHNTLRLFSNNELAHSLTRWNTGLVLGASLWSAVGVLRANGRSWSLRVACLAGLGAAPMLAISAVLDPTDVATTVALESVAVICALVLAVTAGALAAARLARVARVRRFGLMLADLDDGSQLERGLATAVSDPTLRVRFPLSDGTGLVDADGQLHLTQPGRATTVLQAQHRTVAVVEHDRSVDATELLRRFGPAARLAAWNEGLRADLLHQITEQLNARRRIVASADRERQRIERDLHDGAQQRLLALTFEVRTVRATCPEEMAPVLDAALVELRSAQLELRELATTIYPTVVAEAGFDAALHHLAERSRRPVMLDADGVTIDEIDTAHAVYRAVQHVVDVDTEAPVTVIGRADAHSASVELVGAAVTLPDVVLDRVRAVGGTAERSGDDWRISVPCGS